MGLEELMSPELLRAARIGAFEGVFDLLRLLRGPLVGSHALVGLLGLVRLVDILLRGLFGLDFPDCG